MSIFGGEKKEKANLNFTSRADAFSYMLAYQIDKGIEPMEAAKKADEFAGIFATNMGIPNHIEPPSEGVERYLREVNRVVCYCEEHPKAVDMITGVATFIIGAFVGNKAGNESSEPKKIEPIDASKLD